MSSYASYFGFSSKAKKLSPEDAVQELKKRFGGKLPPDMNLNNDTDATLTRYLVARSYDLDASEKMVQSDPFL
jgi:hypothetical protein